MHEQRVKSRFCVGWTKYIYLLLPPFLLKRMQRFSSNVKAKILAHVRIIFACPKVLPSVYLNVRNIFTHACDRNNVMLNFAMITDESYGECVKCGTIYQNYYLIHTYIFQSRWPSSISSNDDVNHEYFA